jgi:hypothetical protein
MGDNASGSSMHIGGVTAGIAPNSAPASANWRINEAGYPASPARSPAATKPSAWPMPA